MLAAVWFSIEWVGHDNTPQIVYSFFWQTEHFQVRTFTQDATVNTLMPSPHLTCTGFWETHPSVGGRAQASSDVARLPPRSFTSTPRAWRGFLALWPWPALTNFQSDRHLPVVNSLNACQHLQLARHHAGVPSDKAGPRSPVSRAHMVDSRQTVSLWNP